MIILVPGTRAPRARETEALARSRRRAWRDSLSSISSHSSVDHRSRLFGTKHSVLIFGVTLRHKP